MGNWQETELVERCRKGDRQALGELLGKYEKPVYNVAFRILGNRDDAADITQSVFLKVFEKLDQYKPEYRFFSWIYRIAVNESINQNKQGWRQKPFSEKDSAAAGTPESEFEASKLSREIQGGLMTLGENYRTVLVLRHFSGLSYREISDTLDIPEKTVKSRLYSARQMMKQSLESRGVLPEPELFEVRKVYQRIDTEAVDAGAGRLRVVNGYDFRTLGFVEVQWDITEDGNVVQQGRSEAPPAAPRKKGVLNLPLAPLTPKPGAEYHLNVRYVLKIDGPWAKQGHVVAWEQFAMPVGAPEGPTLALEDMDRLMLNDAEDAVIVSGEDFTVVVSKATGALESFELGPRGLIDAPLVPNFWRVPLDNDIGFLLMNDMPGRLGVWKTAGPGRSVNSVRAERLAPQAVRVVAEATLPAAGSPYVTTYTIYGSGDVLVEGSFTPGGELPELPRFGMQMAVPASLGTMTWFGRGPHETYWDRKTGAPVGRYSGRVEELVHDYVRPQENGNRTDVRWVTLTDAGGTGLLAVGDPHLSVSAWPYTMEDLEAATHIHKLPRRDSITLNLDHKQMGVGGDDGWGARPHPEYTLESKPYSYRFRLRAYAPGMGTPDELARQRLPEL